MADNIARLEKEDVGDSTLLNEKERTLIESLTEQEVQTLIDIRQKLGRARDDAPYSRMRFPF